MSKIADMFGQGLCALGLHDWQTWLHQRFCRRHGCRAAQRLVSGKWTWGL